MTTDDRHTGASGRSVSRPLDGSSSDWRGLSARRRGAPRVRGIHERPACRSVRSGVRVLLRDLRVRRPRERPRRAPARRSGAWGWSPATRCSCLHYVHRNVRGGLQAGCIPVPVDVTESDFCLDPAAAAAAIGSRTRMILPVDLYGRLADLAALGELASRHGLVVLEDACQAHGASRGGGRGSTPAAAAAFSFYPGKNLGALGDGGALVTDDAAARRAPYVACASTDSGRSTSTRRSAGRHDSTRSRPQRSSASCHCSTNGTSSAASPPTCTARGLAGRRRPACCPTRRIAARSGTSSSSAPPTRPVLPLISRERGIGTGRHYPEPPHLSNAYAAWACRQARSRSPSG